MSSSTFVNPIDKLCLISKLKNAINGKLSQIDGLLDNLRSNIYITELVCNEISCQNQLSNKDQQILAFDILNVIFSFGHHEQNAIKSQIEYLHLHNLVKPPLTDKEKEKEEESPKRFNLFRSSSSKKKLF